MAGSRSRSSAVCGRRWQSELHLPRPRWARSESRKWYIRCSGFASSFSESPPAIGSTRKRSIAKRSADTGDDEQTYSVKANCGREVEADLGEGEMAARQSGPDAVASVRGVRVAKQKNTHTAVEYTCALAVDCTNWARSRRPDAQNAPSRQQTRALQLPNGGSTSAVRMQRFGRSSCESCYTLAKARFALWHDSRCPSTCGRSRASTLL